MKTCILLSFFLIASVASGELGATNPDFVSQMPNWTQPTGYEIYSGYLTFKSTFTKTTKNIHYFFLAKDPYEKVIVWLNGGPGCSSLDGLLTEIGPFIFAEGQDYLNGTANPNTWLNLGSLLFLESPTGVGFSYESGGSSGWSDLQTVSDNYQALLTFFAQYPSYKSSDLWLAGESYAGMYIPWLADYIDANMTKNAINMKGLLIGNPYVGLDVSYWQGQFMATHDMAGPQLRSLFEGSCTPTNMKVASCQYAAKTIAQNTLYVNPYDIYGYCYYADQIPNTGASSELEMRIWERYQRAGFMFLEKEGEFSGKSLKTRIRETLPEAINPDDVSILPCTDALGETLYLRNLDVMEAMHVNTKLTPWNVCSYQVLDGWKNDMGPSYLLLPNLAKKYKILVFSGDADSVCSWQSTNYWFNDLQKNNGGWRQWYTSNNQVGGSVEEGTQSGVTWATVRGAGHMVPATRGQAAYEMVERFLSGQPL